MNFPRPTRLRGIPSWRSEQPVSPHQSVAARRLAGGNTAPVNADQVRWEHCSASVRLARQLSLRHPNHLRRTRTHANAGMTQINFNLANPLHTLFGRAAAASTGGYSNTFQIYVAGQ